MRTSALHMLVYTTHTHTHLECVICSYNTHADLSAVARLADPLQGIIIAVEVAVVFVEHLLGFEGLGLSLRSDIHPHSHMHARTHARTNTHARAHTHKHTHTEHTIRTQTQTLSHTQHTTHNTNTDTDTHIHIHIHTTHNTNTDTWSTGSRAASASCRPRSWRQSSTPSRWRQR